MVFCVSLSGCMVYIVISFFVIVLKDRRLSDFWVVREAFFFRWVGGCAVLGVFSWWFFGCFGGVKIEL